MSKDISQWVESAKTYKMPGWDELSTIPLYMDQVMMFTSEALSLFERNEKTGLLTSSMINNYVKNGVVEHPVHKKYAKEHLSKLLMTSMLKQVLSMQDISVLFKDCADPKALYTDFVAAQDNALHETVAQIDPETDDAAALRSTALRLAAQANAQRAVSERILLALSDKAEKKDKKNSDKK